MVMYQWLWRYLSERRGTIMNKENNVNGTNLYTDLHEALVRATPVPPEMLAVDENTARHLNHVLDVIKACATKEEKSCE